MQFAGIFLAFVYGTVFGSFYNVVGIRGVKGEESPAAGRSHCTTCDRTLTWTELIPIFSWVVQRGRCRGCQQQISWIYPVIELLTGVLFGVSFWIWGLSWWFALALVVSSVLVILLVRVLEQHRTKQQYPDSVDS